MKPPAPGDRSGTSKSPPERVVADASDFAWPPTAEDLQGCGIIRLTADGDPDPSVRAFVHLAAELPSEVAPPAPVAARPPRRPMALPRSGARSRHWGVERPDVSFPFRADGDDPRVGRNASGETWRAAVALAAGVSLAVLSYAQFRGVRGDAIAVVAAVAQATAEPSTPDADTTIEIPAVVAEAVRTVSPPKSASAASRDDSSEPAKPVRATLTRLAADVMDEIRPPEAPSARAAVEPAEVRTAPAPAADVRPQPALLNAAEERAPAPVPAPIAAVRVDPVRGDEDRIRAALARWRTAYSQLDARAAREIWPSVDARALERAFQALKSQDLRFDRCELTVAGGSAHAACVGRAVYVPRVGNQSPRDTPREWTFELKKLDEQWTIASARAS